MAVAVNAGVVDDTDILANERVVDMSEKFKLLQDDTTQFTTMLRRVGSKDCHSSKVEWLEDQLFPRLSALAASITNSAATMAVTADEGAYFRLNDVVRIATTGEALAVSAAPSTDTVGIIRSVGSVAAATAASGAELVIIGNASAQGASLGVRKVTERVAAYNYTQIFRHPYGFTETLAASKLYGGDEPMKERGKKAVEHARAIEYSLFWGARDHDANGVSGTDTEPTQYMGGLFEYISTLVKDPSGAMTKTEFEGFMRDGLTNGTQDKVLFCAPLIAQIISEYARDNWVRSKQPDKKWGNHIDAYVSGAFGYEVPVVVKRDWNEFGITNSQYGTWGFLVDMSAVRQRPLRTRNTKLLLNRQGNSDDQVVEEYLTELSVEIQYEKKHMIIKNATASA